MTKCPECGNDYKQLGNHWQFNQDHRPNLTEKQVNIIKGLILGDGCIDDSNKNSALQVIMTNKKYLEYLDKVFSSLSTSVRLHVTAEESAQQMRDKNFRPDAKAENYSDLYIWRTRTHPKIQQIAEKFKENWLNQKLNPTIFKHWYCSDGCYNNNNKQRYISLAMANFIEDRDKISKLFSRTGLPKPSNYSIAENNVGTKNCSAEWTVGKTQKLFDYMGEPLPGFDDKWPS